MGKASNQWDFGELFEEREFRRTYSVGELTGAVRRALEKQFGRVRVSGEISNFRAQGSGHCYFSLKDSAAQLNCVLFRGESVSHRAALDQGVKVILEGDLTVYEARGQYQLIVRAVELDGIGALQLAFEKLKRKLEGEGLFDVERKRALPAYCFRLGIVTSASAAALRDVLHVTRRRHPGLALTLVPVRVQGQGAAEEIASAIALLNRYSESCPVDRRLQAILVTRGGGSLEDLWAFNEESVARAIVASELPVVSGVGHEIDFTISDFVADLRAPTPSAAAELITEGVYASRNQVLDAAQQLRSLLTREVEHRSAILDQVGRRVQGAHPQRAVDLSRQRLDETTDLIERTMNERRERERLRLQQISRQLAAYQPMRVLERERAAVHGLTERLVHRARDQRDRWGDQLEHWGRALRLLSPLNVLERGYTMTRDSESGEIVGSISDVTVGKSFNTLFHDGEAISEVKAVPPTRGEK